ncbi:MAG: LysM peptidoglycan-binding domain-containing protein [Bacteroidales bacterium]|jgi:LysM repeat protein|nr:LysM peptidoglycan-binding domain-containing protein [Bacteroidales bacterium]
MNLLRVFVVNLLCFLSLQALEAQVEVTVSKKKTVIDGKSYYLHTVRQGETLYSISKAYNVLQKDIVFNNPNCLEGIRIGEELKIPEKPEGATTHQLESDQSIYHIIEKGQTIFSLAQTYGVSKEELYQYNPELEHSPLQVGQVVNIPKKNPSKNTPLQTGYLIHTVKRKETPFSIAKSHNIDLNQLLDANPELDNRNPKIKVGQEIKIPLPDVDPISIPIDVSKTDTIIIRKDLEIMELVQDTSHISSEDPFHHVFTDSSFITADYPIECVPTTQKEFSVAMLLPLYLADNFPASPPDTTMVKDEQGRYVRKDGSYWIHPWSTDAFEFYQGALLAIDSLRKCGLIVKIYLYDTMRDTSKVEQILRSPVMKEVDLIIGPFYTELINKVARFAYENKIYYISPVATNIGSLKNNPYLMQVNSGDINSVGPMVDFISKQENIHVNLIGYKSETDQAIFNAYNNKLRTVLHDSLISTHQFKVDSIPFGYLKRGKTNVVIVTTKNETFINILAAQLNSATRDYVINLYGLANWTRFINLDQEYLHQLEFRYTTAYHVDYSNKNVQQFLRKYRYYYHTEPSPLNRQSGYSPQPYQLPFLGYDVMFYFGSAIQKYGKGFGYCIPQFRLPTLQSDFHFTKIDPFSGYMNTHMDIYRYTKDYTVVKEDVRVEVNESVIEETADKE